MQRRSSDAVQQQCTLRKRSAQLDGRFNNVYLKRGVDREWNPDGLARGEHQAEITLLIRVQCIVMPVVPPMRVAGVVPEAASTCARQCTREDHLLWSKTFRAALSVHTRRTGALLAVK
jgi:hypothetical protein